MADFFEDGAVFHYCDKEFDSLETEACVMSFDAARCNAEFSAPDHGEDSGGPVPWELYAGEIVQHFEHAAPGTCGVVEELVGVGGVGEF